MSVFIRGQVGIEPTNDKWSYSGFGDPSVLGLSAAIGSTYTQLDSNPPGDEWSKTGQADTAWTIQLSLPNSATVLAADTVAALAGTAGAPSDTNRFVTDSDSRLVGGGGGGGAGLPSMFVSTVQSLTGDGSTDDGPALATLISTAMSNSGTIYFTPGKTYRIATNTTVPAGITLWLPQGAVLKADAANLTVLGAIRAGAWLVFQTANGGNIYFSTSSQTGNNSAGVRIPECYPEWFGAVPDGTTDNAPAFATMMTAIAGFPTDPSAGSRWAHASIRLSTGCYGLKDTWRVASLHGLRIEGSGYDSCVVRWIGNAESDTATSGTTSSITKSSATWTTNQWAPSATTTYYAYIHGGTGSGQWGKIASNTATTITFSNTLSVAPDNTSTFYLAPQAVLDLDGCFDGQLDHFSVDVSSSKFARHCIYYHWLSVSAASSSRLKMGRVKATGPWIDSAHQFGGIDDVELNQADMVGLFGCQALGSYNGTSGLYQNGFAFGSGAFSNPLNYSAYDCEAVGCQNGVQVNATNVNWIGGTIQSNADDIFIQNGVQGYSVFSGFRSEGSQRLLNSFTSGSVAMNVRLSDINFQLNSFANNPTSSLPDLIYWSLPGTLVIDNVSAQSGALTAQGVTSATATTAIASGWTLPTANGGVAGWRALVSAGTGQGQRRFITANTATQITVDAAWNVTPDATSQITVYPAPQITTSCNASQHIEIRGLHLMGTPLEKVVQHVLGSPTTSIRSYAELDTTSAILGTLVEGPIDIVPSTNRFYQHMIGFAGEGAIPDAAVTRHKAGKIGVPALETSSVHALAYGNVPAPFIQKGAGSGSTSWTYFLVAKDGSGNALGLPSAGTTVTGQASTLSLAAYNQVWLPNADHVPAVAYDILRGDTSHSIALNVPWYKFPYNDYRTTTDAYTAPVADATGSLTVDGNATVGGTINSATVSTSTIPTAAQLTGLTGGGDTSLHFHSADRARSNHTGTQSLSTIAGGTATGSGYTLPDLTVSGLTTASGGLIAQLALRTVTSNTTATVSDQVIEADATAGNIVVTLPAVATMGKAELFVKKIDSSANTVRVAASGTDTIDGAASVTLSTQFATWDGVSNGSATWDTTTVTGGGSVPASSVTSGTFGPGGYTFPSTLTVTSTLTASSTANFNGNTFAGQWIGQKYFNAGNSSTALTIAPINGAWQKITLTGNCTFTITGPPQAGPLTLWLIQDATGSRTVTWPATVKWAGGTAPTLTTTAGKTDIITLRWDLTNFWGQVVGQNY